MDYGVQQGVQQEVIEHAMARDGGFHDRTARWLQIVAALGLFVIVLVTLANLLLVGGQSANAAAASNQRVQIAAISLAAVAVWIVGLAFVWLAARPRLARLDATMSELRRRLLSLASGHASNPLNPEAVDGQFAEIAAAVNALSGNLLTRQQQSDQTMQQLRTDSMHDHLTGLPNRRSYEAQLKSELARLQRYRFGSSLCLIAIDLDHFKSVNDTYGHDAGDQVLRSFGRLLMQHLRESDFAARIGGEEFAVICPETTLEEARVVAERIRQAMCSTQLDGLPLGVRMTLSAGVTERTDESDVALLQRADALLYRAKASGRNQVCVLPDAVAQTF